MTARRTTRTNHYFVSYHPTPLFRRIVLLHLALHCLPVNDYHSCKPACPCLVLYRVEHRSNSSHHQLGYFAGIYCAACCLSAHISNKTKFCIPYIRTKKYSWTIISLTIQSRIKHKHMCIIFYCTFVILYYEILYSEKLMYPYITRNITSSDEYHPILII